MATGLPGSDLAGAFDRPEESTENGKLDVADQEASLRREGPDASTESREPSETLPATGGGVTAWSFVLALAGTAGLAMTSRIVTRRR